MTYYFVLDSPWTGNVQVHPEQFGVPFRMMKYLQRLFVRMFGAEICGSDTEEEFREAISN